MTLTEEIFFPLLTVHGSFAGNFTHDDVSPANLSAEGGYGRYRHNLWDSPLQELGVPTAAELESEEGDRDGPPYRGFGVPRVDTLYPAVCPIAIYDMRTQR